MLQKRMQKPVTYLPLFLLRLVTRMLTRALIPRTAVLLSRRAHSPFSPACSPRADALGPSAGRLLLCSAAAGRAVICEAVWLCGPVRKDFFWLCCGSVPSLAPHPRAGGWRLPVVAGRGWRRVNACELAPHQGMPVWWQESELHCLQFEWWHWQTPPQTNRVGVPFCGYLALQDLSTLLDKWFHWLILLQQSAELSRPPSKCGFHVNLGRSTAKNRSYLVCLWLLQVPLHYCWLSAEVST